MEATAHNYRLNLGPLGWRAMALPAFAVSCWILAVRHLSLEWTLNEQYHFGWVVPVLALYLLWSRVETAPAMGEPLRSKVIPGCILFIALTEAFLIPLREANADWRLFGGVLTGLAILATLLTFGLIGGARWTAHFAFPLLFWFTAVPWPCGLEVSVMQWLMRHNAMIATELLHWFGIVAEVQGNLIQLSAATVGVDEACSGIRSLQGSLMATLFIGEIFDLPRSRRITLLLLGAGWALVTNSGRTVFLAVMAERGGAEELNRWHDSAGFGVLLICVLTVTITGWALRRGQTSGRTLRSSAAGFGARVDWRSRLSAAAPSALIGTTLIFGGWWGAEAWFRMHESALTRLVDWSFNEPTQAEGFELVEQSPSVRSQLRYDFHTGGRWRDSDGRSWAADYFRWNPGPRVLQTLVVHDPRVCLGASGKELVRTLPAVNFREDGLALPFDAYWFRERTDDVFVFNCVAEDVRQGLGPAQEGRLFTVASRFEAVWAGRRNLGQRRLEVAVWGFRDPKLATDAFEDMLRRQVAIQEIAINAGKPRLSGK